MTIGDQSCEGTGPNKKLAKRAAAEAMLEILGYAKPLPKPGKSVLKQTSVNSAEGGMMEEMQNSDGDSSPDIPEATESTSTGDKEKEKQRKVTFKLDSVARRISLRDPNDSSSGSAFPCHSGLPGVLFMAPTRSNTN